MTAGSEVERKFLVRELPEDLDGWSAQRIEQGYLAVTEEVEVRVRRRADKATLTVKSAPALVRVEEEIPIDAARFERLWPLTADRRIVKTRYSLASSPDALFELDVYDEDLTGLVTLEVEFPDTNAAHAFAPPDWAGDDVTGDRRYSNQSLAVQGVPAGG